MTRSVKEIAADLKEAVQVLGQTAGSIAEAVTGKPPAPAAAPRVEVRLNDGRVVELGALADELIQAP